MKRYAAKIELYIYADSEQDALNQVQDLAKELDKEHDNKATATSLCLAQFGKVGETKNVIK